MGGLQTRPGPKRRDFDFPLVSWAFPRALVLSFLSSKGQFRYRVQREHPIGPSVLQLQQ